MESNTIKITPKVFSEHSNMVCILKKGAKCVNEYQFIKTIGKGTFGTVKLAKHINTGITYVTLSLGHQNIPN